jgi:hypothetical protein
MQPETIEARREYHEVFPAYVESLTKDNSNYEAVLSHANEPENGVKRLARICAAADAARATGIL